MKKIFKCWHKILNCWFEGIALYEDGMVGLHPDAFEEQLPDHLTYDGDDVTAKDFENDDFKHNIMAGDEWIFFDEDQVEVVQFLGIQDKADTEIFEENILTDGKGLYYRVWMEPGKMLVGGLDKEWNQHINPDILKKFTVIGSALEPSKIADAKSLSTILQKS